MKTAKLKTTINLDSKIDEKINIFSKQGLIESKTAFINMSLQKSINDIEKEIKAKKLQKIIKEIKPTKSKLSSEEMIRMIRNNH